MYHQRNLNQWLLLPLITVMSALFVSGAILYRTYQTENELRAQTTLSTSILGHLRQIEAGVLDAETGQRGYILTGNPIYLSPYETGPETYRSNFEALSGLLSGIATPTQRIALEQLSSLADLKFAELAETIRLTDAGRRSEALDLINSDVGKEFMEEIRTHVRDLEAEEQVILLSALSGARAARDTTASILVAAVTLIAMLLGLVWYLFSRAIQLDRTEELLQEVGQHRDRNALLAQELSHRVKNLFAIVTAIVRMTGRGETDVPTVIRKISERIGSLSRAHALTASGTDNVTIALSDLVDTILEPYVDEGHAYSTSGDHLVIPETHLTPLGLILHELVTNAVKYGAWRKDHDGELAIRWTIEDDAMDQNASVVSLTWEETAKSKGGTAQTDPDGSTPSSGFGSRMMEMSAQQLGGTVEKDWSDGLRVELRFDLNTGIDTDN
ncbi:sensor histidine kinase [Dinoroseobacter sp. S375]|uniref:sensor histidine kinase n=1 Tax=Dinoroseobacter sp. S375 TaxID=3415136 RepID=UPI003C7B7D47